MGKNNRARRAAKARKRANRQRSQRRDSHQRGEWAPGEPAFTDEELIVGLVDLAPSRLAGGDDEFVQGAVQRLCSLPARQVRAAVADELRRTVVALWNGGWQPAEVVRQVRRESTAANADLAAAAIAADHAPRATATLDPRWIAQLDELDLPAVGAHAPADAWVATWAESFAPDRPTELISAFEVLSVLRSLPRLDELIPPPGASGARRREPTTSSPADRAVLDRVRSLLIKAESTNFEAEATAFTAKAHELMARHAIDAALLHDNDADGGAPPDAPITIRIAIDDPYADAKSLLLQIVAEANRCRAVFHNGLSIESVVGFEADTTATEMLYTSLLVQAQTALGEAARNAPPGSRPRSRSFRSAFLLAYAHRIGQRLDEINDALVAEAESESGKSVLPVLRSREAQVDDALTERFGDLCSSPVRGGRDMAGWVSGQSAADRAQLSFAFLDDTNDETSAA